MRCALADLQSREPDLTVIGEAADAEEAIAQVPAHQPDVLLLDNAMPGRNGLEAIPDLLAALPKTRIIMLSLQEAPIYADRARSLAGNGYLRKDEPDEIARAIGDGHHRE